jgi:hypothetical protein
MFHLRHPRAGALLALALFCVQTTGVKAASGSVSTMAVPIKIDVSSFPQSAGKAPRTSLSLRFHNAAQVAADEVRFVVRHHGSDAMIVDKGVFSPATLIAHTFSVGLGAPSPGDTSDAAVQYVHFMDGTHWGELRPDVGRLQARDHAGR